MLMVVLMMFGIAILSTTLSNQKLSEKKQEWVNEYYSLETKVAEELAAIDHKVQSLKEEAVSKTQDGQTRTDYYQRALGEMALIVQEDGLYSLEFYVEETHGEYAKYIDVKLSLIIPNETADSKEFLKTKNYKIVMYSESQDLFEYEDIEYGVPFVPDNN